MNRFVQFAVLMTIMYSLMILYDYVKPKKKWSLMIDDNKNKINNNDKQDTSENSQYIRSQLWKKHVEPFTVKKPTNNDPTFLGIKNSAEISILNKQMQKHDNDLNYLKLMVNMLKTKVVASEKQMNDMGQNIEGQLNNI